MKIKYLSVFPIIAGLIFTFTPAAHSQTTSEDISCFSTSTLKYTITDLGLLNPVAINAAGKVVGSYENNHAFLYSNGSVQDLGTGAATAINNNDQITINDGDSFFIYSGGVRTVIASGTAASINDSGQVVGSSNGHAFFYSAGVIHDLGEGKATGINNSGLITGVNAMFENVFFYPDGTQSGPLTVNTGGPVPGAIINNKGNIAGIIFGASGWRSVFFRTSSSTINIGGLSYDLYGRSMTEILGLNNNDQLVGWSNTVNGSQGEQHAYIYINGGIVDLNNLISPPSGWDLNVATAINDGGQIVGVGNSPLGQGHAFLLTPAETCSHTSYVITASASAGGSIAPSGDVSVENGADKGFTITANPGFQISDIQIDGSSVGTSTVYTFNDVASDHSIAASFTAIPTKGTLVIEKATIGGNGTFNFNGNNGLGSFTITTASNTGNKIFSDIAPGVYSITEVNLPKGWAQTDSNCASITVIAGETASCMVTNTANPKLGEIRGTKYVDRDGDGKLREWGTYWLKGVTIYLDTNNNKQLDSGETSTVTNKFGQYRFTNLPTGTYYVREVVQSGWKQTYPSSGGYTIVLAAGKISKNNNFGNFKFGSISGMKFNDLNGNGRMNVGDVGLSGWTINIKGPNNFTSTTVTDINGNYSFQNLGPGTYTLSEVSKNSWYQTAHPQKVKVLSGINSKNNNFGNHFGKISRNK